MTKSNKGIGKGKAIPKPLRFIVKTPEQGGKLPEVDWVDVIGFGRKYLPNPDERINQHISLNTIADNHTLFGERDARRYMNYHFYK